MLQYLILCWLTQYNFCKYGLCNGFIPATVYIHNTKNLPFSMVSLYSNFFVYAYAFVDSSRMYFNKFRYAKTGEIFETTCSKNLRPRFIYFKCRCFELCKSREILSSICFVIYIGFYF